MSAVSPPTAAPAVTAWPPPQAPPPPPKKSRKVLWIVIGVVVVVAVIIIALIAAAVFVAVSTSIDVTAINYTSSDDACGAAGQTSPGFTTSGGSSTQDTLTITNDDILFACTINSVTTTTSGFSISGANVPLSIPAGGTESLSFTIKAPSGSYTGVLTIDIE